CTERTYIVQLTGGSGAPSGGLLSVFTSSILLSLCLHGFLGRLLELWNQPGGCTHPEVLQETGVLLDKIRYARHDRGGHLRLAGPDRRLLRAGRHQPYRTVRSPHTQKTSAVV